MKTRLLKKLRKEAKEEYYMIPECGCEDAFSIKCTDFHSSIVTLSFNEAIEALERYRRNWIIDKCGDIRKEKCYNENLKRIKRYEKNS